MVSNTQWESEVHEICCRENWKLKDKRKYKEERREGSEMHWKKDKMIRHFEKGIIKSMITIEKVTKNMCKRLIEEETEWKIA